MNVDEDAKEKDSYFPLVNMMKRLAESVQVFLKRRQELWEMNRSIVQIGIEMEHDLLPIEFGRNKLKEQAEQTQYIEYIKQAKQNDILH